MTTFMRLLGHWLGLRVGAPRRGCDCSWAERLGCACDWSKRDEREVAP